MPTKGLPVARTNSVWTRAEIDFMRPGYFGQTIFRSDVGSDGTGLANPQNWSTHIADGRLISQGNSLTGEMASLSRAYMPRPRLFDDFMRNVCGLPSVNIQIDGNTRSQTTYIFPDSDAPAIEPITIYHGLPTDAARIAGARVVSYNEDISRVADGGTVGGNVVFEGNRYHEGVIVPGAVATSGRFRINKKDAVGQLRFRVQPYAYGTGLATESPGYVQLSPNMTAAQIIQASTNLNAQLGATTVTAPDGSAYNPAVHDEYILSWAGQLVHVSQLEDDSDPSWRWTQIALGGPVDMEYATGPYFEAPHTLIYLATNDADLATIDWDHLPDEYGKGGDPHILNQAKKMTFAMGALWAPAYSLNGKKYATDLVPGARTVTTTVTVPRSSEYGSDCRFIYDTQEGCAATGLWLVRRFKCGGYDNRRFMHGVRNDAVAFEADAELDLRTFGFERFQTEGGTPALYWEHRQPLA